MRNGASSTDLACIHNTDGVRLSTTLQFAAARETTFKCVFILAHNSCFGILLHNEVFISNATASRSALICTGAGTGDAPRRRTTF